MQQGPYKRDNSLAASTIMALPRRYWKLYLKVNKGCVARFGRHPRCLQTYQLNMVSEAPDRMFVEDSDR